MNQNSVILSNSWQIYHNTNIKMVWTGENPYKVPQDDFNLKAIFGRYNDNYVVFIKSPTSIYMGDYLYGLQNGFNIPDNIEIHA